ncbi:MAG: alpha-L-arabinofuranosidase C-terminal domain-containing protein [Chitinophagaceae bacterium]
MNPASKQAITALILFLGMTAFSLLNSQSQSVAQPKSGNVQIPAELVVKADQPVADISPTMWGVFFEDINQGADGGIYAELIKNRSFEFFKPLMGWKVDQQPFTEGAIMVLSRQEKQTNNPRYMRVSVNNASKGSLSLTNEGFKGMGIKQGLRYDFSLLYKTQSGSVMLHLELLNAKGEVIGHSSLPLTGTDIWKKQSVSFRSDATEIKGQFRIWFEGTGVVDMDMISLFPEDTWKGRPGGMRSDMIQALADMKPGFIRFPGGCIVEGYDLSQRYQWKKTIGPIDERQLIINRWNFEFAHRPAPDYFQTFGLGFFEYFQLAEDIGAEPLPILNCGMACQFNSAEFVPMDQLDPYIQDALDLIEFANGPVTSTWGKIRAEMGHPEPFHMKMIGVGNENWGPQYVERLRAFKKAINEKYADIKIIASSGTDPEGERFNLLDKELRGMKADFIDEHYYRRPEWFLANAKRYDNYPRNTSKIFAGEYAAQSDRTVSINNRNNWLTALSEAAFMTGLERNAAVVGMASYAPLFAHVEGWQWTPDLIWVDNLKTYPTTDYQVQKMFATNKGNKVLPISYGNDVPAGKDSIYATAALDTVTKELIIKVVNASAVAKNIPVRLDGKVSTATSGKLLLLQSNNLDDMNNTEHPDNIMPQTSNVTIKNKRINYTAAPYSFGVIRVAFK